MPVGIGALNVAGAVELCNLILRQIPACRVEILAKLLLVTGADDDGGDGWPLQEPVEGNLRNGLAGLLRHSVQSVHDFEDVLVVQRRTLLGRGVEAAGRRQRMATADLAGEAS